MTDKRLQRSNLNSMNLWPNRQYLCNIFFSRSIWVLQMNTTLYQNREGKTYNWTNLHDYRIYYVNNDYVISLEFLSLSRRRSSSRNVPSGQERGETAAFAGYLSLNRTRNPNSAKRYPPTNDVCWGEWRDEPDERVRGRLIHSKCSRFFIPCLYSIKRLGIDWIFCYSKETFIQSGRLFQNHIFLNHSQQLR